MRPFTPLLLLIALLAAPASALAQDAAVVAHVGTQGLGAGVVFGLTPTINARGSFGVIPLEPTLTVDEVDFTADFPTFIRATLDFYPSPFFFLSAGGLFVNRGGEILVTGELTEPREFGSGGTTYTPQEVGTLTGAFTLRGAMPYLGIGFGNPLGRRVGMMFDLGVGIGDVPTVDLEATGPAAGDPAFADALEAEEAEFEENIPGLLRYFPILSLAVSFRMGG
jgi:hypothetical protein